MKHQITIRAAVDEVGIARFWQQLYAYFQRDLFSDPADENLAYFLGEKYKAAMRQLHDRKENPVQYLFFHRENQEIGFAMPVIYTAENGKCFVLEFCIYPEYRGNGTGKDCAKALLCWAKANGARYGELNCDNAQRERFWQSVGFVKIDVDEDGQILMRLPEEKMPSAVKQLQLKPELCGAILDIGGGGEGVIGQLYGAQVTVIDNRQEELDEAPDCCQKLLMDAASMTFADASFAHVTCFYSLMYMTKAEQEKAIFQAARVLKPGGTLQIWDCCIRCAYPEPFVTQLEVQLPGKQLEVSYGIGKLDAQNEEMICAMCRAAGLQIRTLATDGLHFDIRCEKV